MPLIAQAFAVIAALLHVLFFYLESVTFSRPATWRRFGLGSQQDADNVRQWAFNQGFYNLFLAIGIGVGLILANTGNVVAGEAVVLFACACMVGAGTVLFLLEPRDGPLGGHPGGPAAHRDRDLLPVAGLNDGPGPDPHRDDRCLARRDTSRRMTGRQPTMRAIA